MNIDVNVRDDNGWTPLHFASRENDTLVVKNLLDHGLDVTLRTNKMSHHPFSSREQRYQK